MSGVVFLTKFATPEPALALSFVIVGAGSYVWVSLSARNTTPINTRIHPAMRLGFIGGSSRPAIALQKSLARPSVFRRHPWSGLPSSSAFNQHFGPWVVDQCIQVFLDL